ncbi:MAG: ATP-dependent 6-phosphofructokinase [Oribacterium sp.]|nr:ATP-dependent 6-phosphofructokinase [Oribacterium sp.]
MRVGILTSGGDCQSLNATMRGVGKTLYNIYDNDLSIYGFEDGYHGLIYSEYRKMERSDFSGILNIGGTILGTSRTPFKLIREPDENGLNKVEAMKNTYRQLRLDCLVVLGGNGSLKTANLLQQEGLNVVGCPKTIDNDLWGTDMTFGFHSAVSVATNAIDCIHTTAASHKRVFIVEIMGHKVGMMTLYAGLAGGADIILIPEIPYHIDAVCSKIQERYSHGSPFSIIAVAEGAISYENSILSKKELKKKRSEGKIYPSVSYELADQVFEKTGIEVRVTVPGHTQRGGAPVAYDRVLATRFGVEAAMLIQKKSFGNMVALVNNEIVSVPLAEIAGKLKTVEPESQIIKDARAVGISFGDEV